MTSDGPGLAKLIRAEARSADAFDRGQRRWQAIAGTAGLHRQGGGWSASSPDTAVVLALWSGAADHTRWLARSHDGIARAQRAGYVGLTVETFDVLAVACDLPAGCLSRGVLRTATCLVRPGHLGHALQVQRDVWFPAMRRAGMRWGSLARTQAGDRVSLLVTSW